MFIMPRNKTGVCVQGSALSPLCAALSFSVFVGCGQCFVRVLLYCACSALSLAPLQCPLLWLLSVEALVMVAPCPTSVRVGSSGHHGASVPSAGFLSEARAVEVCDLWVLLLCW